MDLSQKEGYVISTMYNILNSSTHNVVSIEIYFPATFFNLVENDKLDIECTSNCHNVIFIILSQLMQMNKPQQRVLFMCDQMAYLNLFLYKYLLSK